MEKANKLTETIPGWFFKRIKTVDFSYNNFTWESSSSLPTECDRGKISLTTTPLGKAQAHLLLDDGNQSQENSFIYGPPRGRTAQSETKVQCYEPAIMKYLGYYPALTPDEVKERVALARKAQKSWANSSFKQRRLFLRIILKYIIEHQDLISEFS